MKLTKLGSVAFLLLICALVQAQNPDPTRFNDQVKEIVTSVDTDGGDIIFTGSSSVRMWKNVNATYPSAKILNHGFGGSTMYDLLYFLEDLVLDHDPRQVFIYEGDNDISSEISIKEILVTTEEVVSKILKHNPDCSIVFISPKPSIARWDLKKEYEKLNRKLAAYCEGEENLRFADVWNPMLDDDGRVFQDIFLEDDLHMNAKGYAIWTQVLKSFIDQ